MKVNKFWNFRAAADPLTAELLLYGNIGPDDGMGWLFDEVSPKSFKAELDALDPGVDTLNVMINSDGGDVFAGQAMHSMLKRWKGSVNVYIDGMAASIASVVAMAGDKIIMPSNAMMMIHDPWTRAMGNANEFRHLADTLDSIREGMIAAYQNKTKISKQEIIDLLDAETWMTAQEAVDMGFADEIEAEKKVAAAVRGSQLFLNGIGFDLSRFDNAPDMIDVLGTVELDETSGLAPTKRDAERALREVGFSVRSAKTVVAQGWVGVASREERTDENAHPQDAVLHGKYTGSHIHSHPAMGSQGGDAAHNHPHTHNNDNSHAHPHEAGSHAPSGSSGRGRVAVLDEEEDDQRSHSRHEFADEAIAYHDYGNAPQGTGWSKLSLKDFTDKSWGELTDAEKTHIANHFVWSDTGTPPDRFTDLGGGHHKPNGTTGDVGPAVFSAVSSGRMQQASWSNDSGVKSHLASHYHDFGKKAPWENGGSKDEIGSADSSSSIDLFLNYQKTIAQHADLEVA